MVKPLNITFHAKMNKVKVQRTSRKTTVVIKFQTSYIHHRKLLMLTRLTISTVLSPLQLWYELIELWSKIRHRYKTKRTLLLTCLLQRIWVQDKKEQNNYGYCNNNNNNNNYSNNDNDDIHNTPKISEDYWIEMCRFFTWKLHLPFCKSSPSLTKKKISEWNQTLLLLLLLPLHISFPHTNPEVAQQIPRFGLCSHWWW